MPRGLARTGLALFVATVAMAPWLDAQATPARAQALGGTDLSYPNTIHTHIYFEDDVNIFVNPALIYRYRDAVNLSLGFNAGQLSGMGLSPYGGFLIEPGDSGFVFGAYINRDPMLWGEGAAIQPVLDGLVPGGLGGAFDTGSQGGAGASSAAPVFPLDLFVGAGIGPVAFGVNGYIAGGKATAIGDTLTDPDEGAYDHLEDLAKSLYGSVRGGFLYDAEVVQPEIYLGYTSVAAWHDTFGYNTDTPDDPFVSQTEGIKGTGRFLGGVRVQIRSEYTTIAPHVGFAASWGRTFVDQNLGDETMVRNLENNENRFTAQDLNGGLGITYAPSDELRVIWTVSAQLRRIRQYTDDHAGDLDEDVGDVESTVNYATMTQLAGPVASIGGEFDAFRHLTVRGAVRANVLWSQDMGAATSYYGQDVTFDGTTTTDHGPTPTLSATAGFSIPMGPVSLDAALGGLMIGNADMQFFSRLDMNIYFP